MQKTFPLILIFIFSLLTCDSFADYVPLSKKNYQKFNKEKAVVVYGINWGRQWGCAGFENAQLQMLSFIQVEPENEKESISLKTPSKLFVDDVFTPNAIMVNPGKYALNGFDVKIAKSVSDIGHLIGDENNLYENGELIGGTFEVNTGEVVYIGEFGLDCAYDPIPWRYYFEREDFARYNEDFFQKFNYIKNKDLIYRLFQTDQFGQ